MLIIYLFIYMDKDPSYPANIIREIIDQNHDPNQLGTEHDIIKGWISL